MSIYEIYLKDQNLGTIDLLKNICGGKHSIVEGGYSFELGDSLGLTCQNMGIIKASSPLDRKYQSKVDVDTIIRINMLSNTTENFGLTNTILSKLIRENRSDFIFVHEHGDFYLYRIQGHLKVVKHIYEAKNWFDFPVILDGLDFEFGPPLE
ncbi:MAG: hypothetical protein HRU19_30220 [Pseudobacteriovorax sp.]|nr:hypothetical protein [Pseudobacteriovorax sp.]